jgi:cytochrome c biogenesis protein
MSASASATAAGARPTRREDFVESFWRFFSSLRLVIPLIFALALASVAGTFINPSNAGLAEISGAFHASENRWWWQIYLGLELYDLFHSWWFTLLLVLLALNIVACTIERLPRIARVVLHPDLKLTDQVARGLKSVQVIEAGPDASDAWLDASVQAARVAAALRARGFEPRQIREGSTTYLFAQRGSYSRFGVWVVHVSLLTMLGGGIVGRIWGFEGTADVAPGQMFDSFLVRTPTGELLQRKLPFAAQVNDFDVQFYQTGGPKLFRSDISVFDREKGFVKRQNVEVNHPLTQDGITIYQASYRELPDAGRVKLAVTDKQTGQRVERAVGEGEPIALGGVEFALLGYTPRYGRLGPAAKIRRTEAGKSAEFVVFQRRPDFDGLNRPDRFALEMGGLQKTYATGLQIAHDPGARWVFLGCALFLAGLLVAFYSIHRRIWVRIEPGRILLAGSTHRRSPGFDRIFGELKAAIGGA